MRTTLGLVSVFLTGCLATINSPTVTEPVPLYQDFNRTNDLDDEIGERAQYAQLYRPGAEQHLMVMDVPITEADAFDAELPALPTAREVRVALGVVEPRVRRCYPMPVGWTRVDLTVESSGMVIDAHVRGELGESIKRCMERWLMKAPIPPFSSGPLKLEYVLDLR